MACSLNSIITSLMVPISRAADNSTATISRSTTFSFQVEIQTSWDWKRVYQSIAQWEHRDSMLLAEQTWLLSAMATSTWLRTCKETWLEICQCPASGIKASSNWSQEPCRRTKSKSKSICNMKAVECLTLAYWRMGIMDSTRLTIWARSLASASQCINSTLTTSSIRI